MKHLMAIALVLLCACGKSPAEQAKENIAAQAAKEAPAAPAAPAAASTSAPPPPPAAKPAPPPAPDPTTPAELDHALKQAMIDGRDKDVLRFCDMSKLD